MSLICEEADGYTILRIEQGVFIREGVKRFAAKTKELREKGSIRVLVDFTDCEYVSSEGLGAISELWKSAEKLPDGKMVCVLNPSSDNDVHYLFQSVGFAEIMKGCLFTDLEEARKALQA